MNSASSPSVIDVTTDNFEREVIEGSRTRPVIVDFWAPWCQPCLVLGPILEKLVAEHNGEVVLAKVNVDDEQRLAAEFSIQGIPAVKAFRDGKLVLEFVGLLPEEHLRQFINRVLPTPTDKLVQQAANAEKSDIQEAERLYRQVIDTDPHNSHACLALARLALDQGNDAEASEWLDRMDIAGEQEAEAERLRAIIEVRKQAHELSDICEAQRLWEADPKNAQRNFEYGTCLAAEGRYPEALERLLAAAERDRKLATTQVRELMVKIFHIVGVRDPLSDEYRDKLSRVLY